jgi:hypothetical protein
VSLIDLRIEALGIHLLGCADLKTGHPYPNKHYAVACRKKGRKALNGILIETAGHVSDFVYVARWGIEAGLCVTHRVEYKVLDREFDAASDKKLLWHACSKDLGGWSDRFPPGIKNDAPPIATEPMMEVVAETVDPRRMSEDEVAGGFIVARREVFGMPTIERERITRSKLHERIPGIEMAFRVG